MVWPRGSSSSRRSSRHRQLFNFSDQTAVWPNSCSSIHLCRQLSLDNHPLGRQKTDQQCNSTELRAWGAIYLGTSPWQDSLHRLPNRCCNKSKHHPSSVAQPIFSEISSKLLLGLAGSACRHRGRDMIYHRSKSSETKCSTTSIYLEEWRLMEGKTSGIRLSCPNHWINSLAST